MAGIQAVSMSENKNYSRVSGTGYTALASLGVTTAVSFSKNKSIKAFHKPFGLITVILTLLHLGAILHNKNEWKKKAALNDNENLNMQHEGAVNNETSGC